MMHTPSTKAHVSRTVNTDYDDSFRIASTTVPKKYMRIGLPLLLAALFLFDNTIRSIILGTMADAYINVGVFVAITLLIYYAAESYFGFDISKLQERAAWQQITVAALLGALPGCGGAIVVVSQYAAGHMSFAALVAVLVATMGDAAFLLLAKSPQTGLLIIGLGLVVGILSGLAVHALHKPTFMRQEANKNVEHQTCNALLPIPKSQAILWMLLLVFAIPFTLMSAFQVEVTAYTFFGYSVEAPMLIGASAAVMCLLMWAFLPLQSSYYRGLVAEDSVAVTSDDSGSQQKKTQSNRTKSETNQAKRSGLSKIVRRVIHDTNFIMVWVVLAFLLFEIFVHYTGASLTGLFTGALWVAPLIGVLVGFLPGCGPQIIIASLYLQGVAPLSTLLGNAISNDGDALFPAMALAPKAAILATLYSAVPALMIAYSVHYFMS